MNNSFIDGLKNQGLPDGEGTTQTTPSKGNGLFSVLGGGILDPLFINPNGEYSDFLLKIKDRIDVIQKEYINKKNVPLKFHFIDKNNPNTATACSLVVSTLKDNNRIYYYFFLLGCTGKEAMTSGDMMSMFDTNLKLLQQQMNNNALRQNIDISYRTLDAYVDNNLYTIILKEIANEYNISTNDIDWVSVGGCIISPLLTTAQVDEHADIITRTSMTAILTDKHIMYDKTTSDIDISSASLSGNKDYHFNIKTKFNPTNNKQEPSSVTRDLIREDFKVQLSATKRMDQMQIQSYNKVDTDQMICEASGFVSALPYTAEVINPQNPAFKTTVARLSPHIIITDTSAAIMTLRFKLLSLAVGCNMLDKKNYIQALYNNIGTKNDPGFLNYICNLYNCDKPQDIAPIDFKSKKPEDIYTDLQAMFTGSPIVSMDILPYTSTSHIDETFAIAAIGENYEERYAALNDIIVSAHELTNGHFSKQFNPDRIFAMKAIPFPAGYTSIQNVIKDIRHVDLPFVCGNIKNDPEKLHIFLKSETPQSVEYDPFMGKIRTFNNIGMREAVITARGTRVTFHAEFISELVRSVQAAGLNPSYMESTTFQTSDFSYQGYGAFFQNAGIAQGGVFGQAIGNQSWNPGSMFLFSPFGR